MKQINKLLIIWGIVSILLSCQSKSYTIGTFSKQNNPHKFILNADSTYNYFYMVGGFVDKHSSGEWSQIDKNTIILNSDLQSNVIPLKINIIPTKNKRNNIRLDMTISGKHEKDYRAVPFINNFWLPDLNSDRGSYDFDSFAPINQIYFKVSKEPTSIERFGTYKEYNVLETETKQLRLNDGDSVHITINIVDSLFSYRVFNNTKIKFNKDKLIFKDFEDQNKTNKLDLNK